MDRPLLHALVAFTITAPAAAQNSSAGQSGPRPLLPRDREVALARSAAPAAVSDSATIYVLTGTGYEVAVQGASGAACYVSRDWIASVEPHCFDPEGAATIMRVHMRRVELLHQGKTRAEADQEVAAAITSGALRLARRPAVSYMLSSAQELISDDGRPVGAWKPHLMIYYPYLTGREVGLSAGEQTAGLMMVDSGKLNANLVIVVPDFVEPRFPEAARR